MALLDDDTTICLMCRYYTLLKCGAKMRHGSLGWASLVRLVVMTARVKFKSFKSPVTCWDLCDLFFIYLIITRTLAYDERLVGLVFFYLIITRIQTILAYDERLVGLDATCPWVFSLTPITPATSGKHPCLSPPRTLNHNKQ